MIEFIVLIILIIAFVFLIYPIVTIPTFLINISLLLIIALRAGIDLKEMKMHLYYLWAAFLTALIFIANQYGFLRTVFSFLSAIRIIYITQAAILIFVLAHLIAFSHNTIKGFVRDWKKSRTIHAK